MELNSNEERGKSIAQTQRRRREEEDKMLNKLTMLQPPKNVYKNGGRFGRTKCYKKTLQQEEEDPKRKKP